MKFNEFIKTPDVSHNDPGPIYKIVSSFNRAEVVFMPDQAEEKPIKLLKSYPIGANDGIYLTLKKHFKLEDYFVVENIPYEELPNSATEVGAKVGVMFIAKGLRFGGYSRILKKVEKPMVNQGKRLVGKGALFLSFPNPMNTVNRRQRFRLFPHIEDLFCEISGFAARRNSPIPTFPVRNLSDLGASLLMLNINQEHWPEVGDEMFIRLTLFTASKGYNLKRGVVVSEEEVKTGSVTQQKFVLKCKVRHRQQPNERTIEVGMLFLAYAREGVSADPKDFPRLTYLPIDPTLGIENMLSWVNRVQQLRRMEEKEKGLVE